ncbi:hypothetical protein Syun_013754 [Stephania yunnanensis]|uniref:Uncharacterized protein n=1 Tax=Stephania yunnanensis TaxID=152371 RepID=A0AAP0P8Y6_9MAGN
MEAVEVWEAWRSREAEESGGMVGARSAVEQRGLAPSRGGAPEEQWEAAPGGAAGERAREGGTGGSGGRRAARRSGEEEGAHRRAAGRSAAGGGAAGGGRSEERREAHAAFGFKGMNDFLGRKWVGSDQTEGLRFSDFPNHHQTANHQNRNQTELRFARFGRFGCGFGARQRRGSGARRRWTFARWKATTMAMDSAAAVSGARSSGSDGVRGR